MRNKSIEKIKGCYKTQYKKWDEQIQELERFFKINKLPNTIKIDSITTVAHVPTFINSHLDIVKENNGNPTFYPYINRLKLLKKAIENETKL